MQGAGGAGPAEGDAKALGLMAEMETGGWGEGRLTEADRAGGRHLGRILCSVKVRWSRGSMLLLVVFFTAASYGAHDGKSFRRVKYLYLLC